jgi:hypothetical protein
MIMGITAALGLANYSLNASSNIVKQLVAVGLAREGVEAVIPMIIIKIATRVSTRV